MKIILQNSSQVVKRVFTETFNYLSNPDVFIGNHYINGQPLSVGSTLVINASSSTTHVSDVYKVPIQKGNKVTFYVCRNDKYPQVYVVDSSMTILSVVPLPSGSGNIKVEQTINITEDGAAYFIAGNLGGTTDTNIPYTETYVTRYGARS